MNTNFNNNLKSPRHGFTLTEMLFVVAILAVLGTMTAGILGKAQKDAQIAATRSRITQIEAIMQTVIEDFEVRRLPFRNAQLASQSGATKRTEVLNLRRRVVAAMLQAEFPSALFDVTNNVFIPNPEIGQLITTTDPIGGATDDFQSWLDNAYSSTFTMALKTEVETAEMSYWQSFTGNAFLDQPGEFLYLILQRIDIDGSSALESLGPNVVVNTDGDMFPEIVDAFGDSMQLRIVQVQATSDSPASKNAIWTDVAPANINWEQSSPIGIANFKIPNGYQFLNPAIPRSLNKIRFQVVSPNLEEIE